MMAATRQQKEWIALAVLAVIAASFWYFYVGRPGGRGSALSASNNYAPINAQDYAPIFSGMTKAQGTEYKSAGRNIFVMGAMPVEAAKQAVVKPPFVPFGPMPQIIPPPQLPMVFFGYGMLPAGGARQAFLKEEQSDEVHIVSEGDVLLNHIRIVHIGNERIEFEDTNTGLRNSKNLDAGPAA
jgi:hypothetical protein